MNLWFSPRDAYELMQDGYGLYEFEVAEFQVKEFEIFLPREGIIKQREISLESVWNLENI